MNIQRILKIELLFLAIISFLAVPASFLWDYLPDNYYSITSVSSSVSFFSYYLTSALAMVAYVVGFWIVLPFIFFLGFYSFIFSKRESLIDGLAVIPLILFSLSSFLLIYPDGVGSGFRFILEQNFSLIFIGLLIPIFLFFFLWATFRSSFIELLLAFFAKVATLFKKKDSDEISSSSYSNEGNALDKARHSLMQIKVKAMSYLRGDEPQTQTTLPLEKTPIHPMTEAPPQENVEELSEETAEENIEELDEESSEESEEEATEEVEEKVVAKPTPPVKPQKKKTEEKDYFQIVGAFSKPKKVSATSAPKNDYYEHIARSIEDKFAEFNVEGKIVNVLKGPIVDTFELELGSGVRVGKIEGFEDDLGLALQGVNVRIIPQMKGKSTMGIEVPRRMADREIIYLDQILNSPEFQKTNAQLPLAMGKDVYGKPAITDLASLPHLLVAGTTGSGKSVYLNSILVSLLVKKSPSQMKLILIDPKRVELAMFSKLPHLLMPTVTDHKKASVAFLWAIEEMERRYQVLLEASVKNIAAFNDKWEEKKNDPEFVYSLKKYYPEDKTDFHLPYIVIVIDEFANLMSSNSGKEIEQSISTLAAKARASGIHVILATQRPSVDVVSGIVKTNFPTRIAFRVAAPQDSKTILNVGGAEKLLGRGDMLFLKDADMLRMHSAYIVDEEIEATTSELSKLEIEYDAGALEMLEREAQEAIRGAGLAGGNPAEEDEYYPKALDLVLQTRTASATMLQRCLGIGYPRAGKLIDLLEANGVISPPDGAKPRKVLITSAGGDDTEH